MIDDPRRWTRRLQVVVGIALLVPLGVGVWACWPLPAVTVPAIQTTAGLDTKRTDVVIDQQWWNRALWSQPAAARVAAQATNAAPIKLFSLMTRQGRPSAMLDTGKGLVTLAAGESAQGITVVKVDATGVDIQVGGSPQRLELKR